jgi:hypothetical protein
MNPRVKEVKYKSQHKLILTFLNEEVKEFDFAHYLKYPVYELLRDESFCHKANVVNGTVAWNDEIDFDPDTLYKESRLVQSN